MHCYGDAMPSADNLQYFLEVARMQRLTDAARILEVDHTTVGRRITALERAVGHRLFDRAPGGWRLTEAGKRLLPRAEQVESAVVAAFDSQSAPGPLSGTVRLATPDGFGAFVLAPNLVRLKRIHPHLDIELVTATVHNMLADRHFDVAVTLEKPTSRAVRSEVLGSYDLRLYATREYLDRAPELTTPSDLKKHTIIWYVNAVLDVEPLRILDTLLTEHSASVQISNIAGHWQAARTGLGIAPLPAYIGNDDDRLIQVLPDQVQVRRDYWLVLPKELERLERVQTMVRFLQSLFVTSPDLTPPVR
jgi:DNA-binding transcriptional LysR family regulator